MEEAPQRVELPAAFEDLEVDALVNLVGMQYSFYVDTAPSSPL